MPSIHLTNPTLPPSEDIFTLLKDLSQKNRLVNLSFRNQLDKTRDVARSFQSKTTEEKAKIQKSRFNLAVGGVGAVTPIFVTTLGLAAGLNPATMNLWTALSQAVQQGSTALTTNQENQKQSILTGVDYELEGNSRVLNDHSEIIRQLQQEAKQDEALMREAMQQELRAAETATSNG